MAEWTEWIPKEWLPKWFPKVEEKEPYPFLAEWGTPHIDEGQWTGVDASLPLEPKIPYRFIYDIEGTGVFWKDPEDLAQEIRVKLKEKYGLLGDDFEVEYWHYDPEAKTFEVQVKRIPPFITTPPETTETAAAVIITALLVTAVIVIVVGTYFTVNLILRNTEKWKEIVVEPVKKWMELMKELKPVFIIVGVGFLGAVGAYIFKQVAKTRKT